jgi:thiol-disulfide isomerase/thioredoxin
MKKALFAIIAAALATFAILVISRLQSSGEQAEASCPAAAKKVVNFQAASPPRPVSTIAFQQADGGPTTLAAYKGSGVVLNFWATWCAPCVREMPSLLRLGDRIAGDGVRVLPLSEDRKGAPVVRKFYRQHGLEAFPVLIDPKGKVLRASAVRGLPTTLLIDGNGREVGRVTGPLEWDSEDAITLVRACIGNKPGKP